MDCNVNPLFIPRSTTNNIFIIINTQENISAIRVCKSRNLLHKFCWFYLIYFIFEETILVTIRVA